MGEIILTRHTSYTEHAFVTYYPLMRIQIQAETFSIYRKTSFLDLYPKKLDFEAEKKKKINK